MPTPTIDPAAPVGIDLERAPELAAQLRKVAGLLTDARVIVRSALVEVGRPAATVQRATEATSAWADDAAHDILRRVALVVEADGQAPDVAWEAALHWRPRAGVVDWFEDLRPEQRWYVTFSHPEVIAGVDGIPVVHRYAANRVLLARTAALEGRHGRDEAELAASGRQILVVDAGGDGQVVEVLGDLDTATHVVIVVPGVGSDSGDLDRLAADAAHLEQAATDAAHDSERPGVVATVVWIGYDAPDHLLAAGGRGAGDAAHDGARPLRSIVRWLAGSTAPDGSPRHVTVVGHSYGSVVAGEAAEDGLAAGDLVLVGSPGAGHHDVDDLDLPSGAQVWAARAAGDRISLRRFAFWLDSAYGTDPVTDAYGACTFATAGAHGHGQYLAPGTESLANLARIVAAEPEAVTALHGDCPAG